MVQNIILNAITSAEKDLGNILSNEIKSSIKI